MKFIDYYKILGLHKNASLEEIKKNYKKLAQRHHPDLNRQQGAEDQFKEIAQAYDVLKSARKRRAYDEEYLNYYKNKTTDNHTHTEHQYKSTSSSYEDTKHKSHYSHYSKASILNLTIEEAYHGTIKSIFHNNHSLEKPSTDSIIIPRGAKHGQIIQHRNKTCHDEVIQQYELHILPHPFYSIVDENLHMLVPVSPWEAALGLSINLPTLAGLLKINIPADSTNGTKLKLTGKGWPLSNQSHGPLYLSLSIVNPKMDDQTIHKLYQRLAQQSKYNPREHLLAHHTP